MGKMCSGRKRAFVCAVLGLAPFANAARLGHPSYSASASTAAQKQWNIVADPGYATDGSTTTTYSSPASLHEVDADGNFYLVKILVDVAVSASHPNGIVEKDFSGATQSYTFSPSEIPNQSGAVQVFWSLVQPSSPGVMPAMPPLPADISSLDLSNDEDTHNLIFDNTSPQTSTVLFQNVQNPGFQPLIPDPELKQYPIYFPHADFYEGYFQTDSESPITAFHDGGDNNPNGIDPSPVVSASASGTAPEPAGIFGLGMVGVVLMRRNRATASKPV